MTTEEIPGSYLTLKYLKTNLRLTGKSKDDLLNSIIQDCNIQVDKLIAPFAGEIPIIPGDRISIYATEVALTWAKYCWYRDFSQLDRARLQREEFVLKSTSLINVLQSHRTTRTKTTVFSTDPQDDQIILPNQKYDTILD